MPSSVPLRTSSSRRLVALILVLLASSGGRSPVAALESAPVVPLTVLEAKIPEAPGVLADESAIEAAIEDVRDARDRAGLEYTYRNLFGPADVIVLPGQRVDNFVVRYEQTAGVLLPLLGSKIAQQLDVLSAQEREQLAVIALQEVRRTRLGQLRNAYVQYWSLLSQRDLAQAYLESARGERDQADSLRKEGFWTATDLLDFLTSVEKIEAQSQELQSSAGAQLALIDSAIGAEVVRFRPVAPAFFDKCRPDRTQALESAYSVDTLLAQYSANTVLVQEQLARVRGATIDSNAVAQVGSETDINHEISGYSLNAGVNVSFPRHARDEERALRSRYDAELKTLALEDAQRRVEIASSVDSILDDIAGSQVTLEQAIGNERTGEADLKIALTRFNLLKQISDAAFNDVFAKRNALYVAQRSLAEANASLLVNGNDLLVVAPGACGAPYVPIPAWTVAPSPTPKPPRISPEAATSARPPTPSALPTMQASGAAPSAQASTEVSTPSAAATASLPSAIPSALPSTPPPSPTTPAPTTQPSAAAPAPSATPTPSGTTPAASAPAPKSSAAPAAYSPSCASECAVPWPVWLIAATKALFGAGAAHG